MNRDTAIAYAWKPITEPPEGGFVPGCRYLGGYWHQNHWRSDVYQYNHHMWLVAGVMVATPHYWQDEPPPPVALAVSPLEPPPDWQGSLPPYTIPPPTGLPAPARNLRTLAAFVSAGKHYLTMNEAIDMFDAVAREGKYITYVTPQGSWAPQLDAETYNCLGYRFQRR